MQQQHHTHGGLTFTLEPLTEASGPMRLIWLHGWRQDKESLRTLAHSLLPLGETWLIDTPGHGTAPLPAADADLSPAAHAHALRSWLASLAPCPTIIIGHSMGFRLALHIAAQGGVPLRAIIGLGAAGVPKPLTGHNKWRALYIRQFMKLGHKVKPFLGEGLLNTLRNRYDSTDNKACPAALRTLFLATVKDDASAMMAGIQTPTLLLYGAEDTDTPPALGQKMQSLLPYAQLHVLPGLNHFTILTHGRHVVAGLVERFIKG